MQPQPLTSNRSPIPIDQPPGSAMDRVRRVIDLIRPSIQADGGDLEFISFRDGVVQVRLHGACVGCPSSKVTLQLGIEQNLRQHVPEVERLEAID